MPRGGFGTLFVKLEVLVPSDTTLKFTSLWTGVQTSIKTLALSCIIWYIYLKGHGYPFVL